MKHYRDSRQKKSSRKKAQQLGFVVLIIVLAIAFRGIAKQQGVAINSAMVTAIQNMIVGKELQQSRVAIAQLRDANKVLQNILEQKGVSPMLLIPNTTPVRVISTPPQVIAGVIKGVILENNQAASVLGQLVLDGKGNAIGFVEEQNQNHITITTYAKAENQVTTLHVSSGNTVTLTGVGNGGFKAEVPKTIPIQKGDMLIETFPTARTIAVVEQVEVDNRNPLQTVYAQMPSNVQSLGMVLVEIPQ